MFKKFLPVLSIVTFLLTAFFSLQPPRLRRPGCCAFRIFTLTASPSRMPGIFGPPVSDGSAIRLTAHPGMEVFAKFSPDGKWIAFTGQYDGDEQVYVMPAGGGVPRPANFYPARTFNAALGLGQSGLVGRAMANASSSNRNRTHGRCRLRASTQCQSMVGLQ